MRENVSAVPNRDERQIGMTQREALQETVRQRDEPNRLQDTALASCEAYAERRYFFFAARSGRRGLGLSRCGSVFWTRSKRYRSASRACALASRSGFSFTGIAFAM